MLFRSLAIRLKILVTIYLDLRILFEGYIYIYIYIGTELGLRVREGKSISKFFLKLQVSIHLEEKCYVHNIFTTFSQQIVNGSLLLIVMSEQKK